MYNLETAIRSCLSVWGLTRLERNPAWLPWAAAVTRGHGFHPDPAKPYKYRLFRMAEPGFIAKPILNVPQHLYVVNVPDTDYREIDLVQDPDNRKRYVIPEQPGAPFIVRLEVRMLNNTTEKRYYIWLPED